MVLVAALSAVAISAPVSLGTSGATPIVGNAATGRAIFISTNYDVYSCGGCHMLKAANSLGSIGPNLDKLKPSYATIIKFVTNGFKRTARYPSGMSPYGATSARSARNRSKTAPPSSTNPQVGRLLTQARLPRRAARAVATGQR